MSPSRRAIVLSLCLLLPAMLASIAIGNVTIPVRDVLLTFLQQISGQASTTSTPSHYATILFSLRLPRTIMIALTGAALAGSGGAYQGLFRNPLADPYLIGAASGAGLGAVAAMSIRWPYTWAGLLAVPASAFVGALLTIVIVYHIARTGKSISTTSLILAGVATSAFASAITAYLMLISTNEIHRALAWLLGGSALSGWQPVLAMLPYVLIGLGALLLLGHPLNVLQFGDEQAQQLGLPVERVRRLIIAAASLATAAAVAFSGIIGFAGLIVPHLVRLIWGADYRKLLPLAMIHGASLLLITDIISRVIARPQEIPVGIITSLLGAPFFVWVLRRSRQQQGW